MKIVITGGAGFIASHIADAYVAAGHRVVVIDNLYSGLRNNVPAKAKFYKADIRDAKAMDRIFKKERPDVLNHHAALISVTQSVREPRETFATNAVGTLNAVLAFALSGPQKKKVIFSSTGGAIYGNPKRIPADESTPPDPFSPYALTKQIDEQIIDYLAKAYDMNYVIFRYANVYGPRQKAQGGAGIFPIFTNLMRQGRTPTIFGDGKKTRDYVYVEDVARASVLALKKGVRTTLNIASAKETSDDEVYSAIAKALGFKKKALYTPKRAGEVYRISMSAKKAKRVIGWSPRYSLAEGVAKTLQSFQ